MTALLISLIITLALLIVAAMWATYLLHKKIGIYKEQQRKWAKEPCIDSLQYALRMTRKYADKYHPDGEPQLNLATYKISQYLKQYRYNEKNGKNIQHNEHSND